LIKTTKLSISNDQELNLVKILKREIVGI